MIEAGPNWDLGVLCVLFRASLPLAAARGSGQRASPLQKAGVVCSCAAARMFFFLGMGMAVVVGLLLLLLCGCVVKVLCACCAACCCGVVEMTYVVAKPARLIQPCASASPTHVVMRSLR